MDNNTEKPLIDIEQNSQSLKINRDIYLRILKRAIEQTRGDIQALENALPLDDFTKIQAISHRLKGDYDNMRITPLSSVAKELNEIVKTTQDKDRMVTLVTEFKTFYLKLEEFLART